MEIVSSPIEMQRLAEELRATDKRIALVPTMGYLHEGHLSLVRLAREKADIVVLSIFVNPIQFGENEDFSQYPRNMQKDLQLAEKEGVDIVFTPSAKEIYPADFETSVQVPKLSNHLCGLSRSDFLGGVATVIPILFNITKPHMAIFGEKDYQQLLVIRRLVKDLYFEVEIIGAPIVRELDGLAMSSRNAYLTPQERELATSLYEALQEASLRIRQGEKNVASLYGKMTAFFSQNPLFRIDYIEFKNATTLAPVSQIQPPVLIAIAIWVGKTRLIDNLIIF